MLSVLTIIKIIIINNQRGIRKLWEVKINNDNKKTGFA